MTGNIVTSNEYWSNEQQKTTQKQSFDVKYAIVVQLNGAGDPILRFMGETSPSSKIYKRMKHYTNPQVGDRVMLVGSGTSFIIVGGWL